MYDLNEVKKKIQFVSPDREDNSDLYDQLKNPDDCFGKGYQEGDKYCVQCVVLSELDGRRESLSTFCKELTGEPKPKTVGQVGSEKPKPEKKGVTQIMENKKEIGSVTGTSELIRDMLAKGKSQEEIVAALIPMFVEKGATEALAKKRIRPLIYRAMKKGGKPAAKETM